MEQNNVSPSIPVASPVIPPTPPIPPQPPLPAPPVPVQNYVQPQPQYYQPPVNPPQMPASPGKPNKWIIFGVIGVLVLFLLVGIVLYAAFGTKQSGNGGRIGAKTGNLFTGNLSEEGRLQAKIQIDTDADTIPDFVEEGAGLNPNVSEFTRCDNGGCGKSDAANVGSKNTLIILDSSGSMALQIGGKTKMDLAKEAIKSFVSSLPATDNIGLMVYGHKGSNAQSSKSLSCSSADIIASMGSVNSSSVDNYLSQIKPVGWTPIGLAIERGMAAFSGKEGQSNEIIIVSDGNETCETNPSAKAALAYTSGSKIQVNVIGFAVAANEQSSLEAISTSGGGSFMTASSADDIFMRMSEMRHKNFEKFQADTTCIVNKSQEELDCLKDVQNKAKNYINPFIEANYSNGGLYNLYSDLNSKI